jgi:WD40 repeat protein
VWDADKGAVVKTFTPDPPKGSDRGAWGLRAAASPDGKTVAVYNVNGEEVTLWDAATGNKTATITDPPGKVNQVAFLSPGWLLESRGGVHRNRPVRSHLPAITEVGKVHPGSAPAFAPSADRITLARNDGNTVTLYRVTADRDSVAVNATGASVAGMSPSGCLALSPDGRLLALTDAAYRLAIYDAETGKPKRRLRRHVELVAKSAEITAMAFSPDGKTLAVGDVSSLGLYDVDSGRERGWVAAAWVRSLAYSADGKTLAAGLRYAPGLVLWETAELVAK